MNQIKEKRIALLKRIQHLERVAVAYSGGVDSALLLQVSRNTLGESNTLAIIVKTELLPEYDFQHAILNLVNMGVRSAIIEKSVLGIKEVSRNSKDRCYYCKKEIFSAIIGEAGVRGFKNILDGTNYNDLSDSFRPGISALEELGIISPFAESGITKDEIRTWAKELDLEIWDKPSSSCLATRIPYNQHLEIDRLKLIENAENILRSMSFKQFRVRVHDNIARIELDLKDLQDLLKNKNRVSLVKKFKVLGFKFVTLDIEGFRSGSMDI